MHALSATESQGKQQCLLVTVSNDKADEVPLYSVMKLSLHVNVASHTENHALDTQTSSASSIREDDQMLGNHHRHQTCCLCV
jgi:hypothetical protein